jgi:hypothetical protein
MSTIYKWMDTETAVSAGDLTSADMVLVYDDSAKTMKKATFSDVAGAAGGGVVNTTATQLTLTAALHGNRTLTWNATASSAITLPQATGTGNKYRIVLQTAATGTSHTIKVGNATDVINGLQLVLTSSSANVIAYKATATDDTITLNGTTIGGVIFSEYTITDVKTGTFQVVGIDYSTGTTATPFSAGV